MVNKKFAMNRIRVVTASMRTRLLAVCIVCSAVALVIQAVLFQMTSSGLIYKQAKDASLNSLQNMQDDIYAYIKSVESDMIDVYNNEDFIQNLANGIPLADMKSKYDNLAYNMSLSVFEPAQNIDAIYIYDINNNLLSSYRHASTPIYSYPADIYDDGSQTNAGIVKSYVESDNMVMLVSSYSNSSRNKNIVRFVMKIYTNNVTRKIGYIVCDADEKSLQKIIDKYSYSQDQIVWLQPVGDRPVIMTGNLTNGNKENYNNAVSLVSSNRLAPNNVIGSGNSVFFEMPQRKYNLEAFSLMPQFLLEETQSILNRTLIVVALLTVFIFSIVSVFILRGLTQPLERMVHTVDRIKHGDTALRLPKLKDDEIGKLGGAINEMLDRIEDLLTREYKSKLLLNHAEYKALQAQVNPHFLYNTLDTMSSIAASGQNAVVSSLCKALSNIFRYSINMKEPLATIDNEIIHIKNFMYVMNVRMQNSIGMDIDIDSSLLKETIPRISLQPLVENAILHGLKNTRGEKKIKLTARRENDDIIISVIDNGIGMDTEQINQLLEGSEVGALGEGNSIGLKNINARVKLLFGDAYGVRITSVIGVGSEVSLCIPSMSKREVKE